MTLRLHRLLLVVVSLVGLASVRVSVLPAQTMAIALAAVDTVATVSDLSGSPTTHVLTLSVSVNGCAQGKNCNVFMSAEQTGTAAMSSIVWSRTSATCASGSTAVGSGTTPNTGGTAIYSLTGRTTGTGQNKVDASGSTTVYLCSTATLGWSTAPFSSPYRLYFSVVRQ